MLQTLFTYDDGSPSLFRRLGLGANNVGFEMHAIRFRERLLTKSSLHHTGISHLSPFVQSHGKSISRNGLANHSENDLIRKFAEPRDVIWKAAVAQLEAQVIIIKRNSIPFSDQTQAIASIFNAYKAGRDAVQRTYQRFFYPTPSGPD